MMQEETKEQQKPTRQRLAEWSKTPEGRESYENVASEMRREISENPLNQDGLEEEFRHYCFDFKDPDTGEDIPKNQISFNVEDALNVARHFAQWGAEHLKK